MQSIKKFIAENIWLFVIVVLAGFIYFYKISTVPNGFYIDEAFPAYNAYSILKTGKDEYGKYFPIVFRFYGSYNPSLYTYLTVIPEAIFGLNVFSARSISVICGLAFGVIVYLFFLSSDLKNNKILSKIGLIIALGSPWIIFYSRIGYEVTLGLLLFAAGAYFLWKSLFKPVNFIWSILFFSLSTYAAYSERFIVPLTLLIFLVVFRKTTLSKKYRKYLILGIVEGIITQMPNIYLLFTPAFFPKTNEFAAPSLVIQTGKLDSFLPHWLSFILAWIREFLSQYFEYFSPRSLFFVPDPDAQRSIPSLSVFYSWMIIPYFVGIYNFYKNRLNNFYKFLFIILIVTPIPAALTKDPFSTHRALPLAFPLIAILSLGIYEIIKNIKAYWFWSLTILVITLSTIYFWRGYFVFLPQERAFVWQYGFDKLAQEIQMHPNLNFVVDQERIKPAYINLAFFLKYPPDLFQKSVDQNVKNNYYSVTPFNDYYHFGQVETRNIDWKTDPLKSQVLVGDEYTISDSQAKEHKLTKIFEIRDPLLRIVFEGYITNPQKLVQ